MIHVIDNEKINARLFCVWKKIELVLLRQACSTVIQFFILQVQHKCLICGSLIIQQLQSLKGHMTIHRMALEDYFNKYVCTEDDGEQEDPGLQV